MHHPFLYGLTLPSFAARYRYWPVGCTLCLLNLHYWDQARLFCVWYLWTFVIKKFIFILISTIFIRCISKVFFSTDNCAILVSYIVPDHVLELQRWYTKVKKITLPLNIENMRVLFVSDDDGSRVVLGTVIVNRRENCNINQSDCQLQAANLPDLAM